MDPDEILETIRTAIRDGDHEAATDLFHVLDLWLCGGGFLPKKWNNAPSPAIPTSPAEQVLTTLTNTLTKLDDAVKQGDFNGIATYSQAARTLADTHRSLIG